MILAPSVCVFLGWLEARSAMAKIRRPAVFESILQAYPFLSWLQSPKLYASAARLVCVAELALAGTLLLPVPAIRLAGCCGMFVFLLLASAAIYGRYRNGEKQFACGCSGNLDEQATASSMMLRNALLLFATLYGAAGYVGPASSADYGIGLALLLAFDLSQAAAIQEGRVRSWKALGSDLT
jgi:hypothetical protein